MKSFSNFFSLTGKLSYFGLRALASVFVPPYEWQYLFMQIEAIGWQSVPLISAAGLALGVVMTLHTRSTLVIFGAESEAPHLQSAAFFNELGPLVTGLLVAGRVGAGIGAELANMRVTEQIDAIEAISIDSFKFLVVTRIMACILAVPLLTVFMDFAALFGGYFSEFAISHMSFERYLSSAFNSMAWANYIPPTLKTAVFGLIIGTVSCYYGYTTNEGSDGVRRAATNSVVLSSLLIILSDVVLVKTIFFFFPGMPYERTAANPVHRSVERLLRQEGVSGCIFLCRRRRSLVRHGAKRHRQERHAQDDDWIAEAG